MTRRPRRAAGPDAPTRLTPADLWREALSGLVGKLSRTVLTITGAALGIATFVAVINLTTTAAAQVSDVFLSPQARLVRLKDASPDPGRHLGLLPTAEESVADLHGVLAATTMWQVLDERESAVAVTTPTDDTDARLETRAVTPAARDVLGLTLAAGRFLDDLDQAERTHAAVLGRGAATRLGVTDVWLAPAILVDGVAYQVVGIVDRGDHDPGVASAVLLPTRTVLAEHGPPSPLRPAELVAWTSIGAAAQVAHEAPLAANPLQPDLVEAQPLPGASQARRAVDGTLMTLLLVLSATTLVVAVVSITNLSTVGVFERRYEIGLRRSMGAQRRHIIAQVLLENGIIGLVGGLLGTAVGNTIVIAVALVAGWTALINPWTTVLAPLAGLILGVVAGIHPAVQAARIEPADALRS